MNNTYKIIFKMWDCADWCCTNLDYYLSKNWIILEEEIEDNNTTIKREVNFWWEISIYEHIMKNEYNINIWTHDWKYNNNTFEDDEKFDFIIKEDVIINKDKKYPSWEYEKIYQYKLLDKDNNFSKLIFNEMEDVYNYIIEEIYKDTIIQ